jgi:hypothetical protein
MSSFGFIFLLFGFFFAAPVDYNCMEDQISGSLIQIYRNLGIEISSLPYTAQRDKIQDFLRRNANVCVDMKELAEEIKYVSSCTLTRWMSEIRKSAKGQCPAVVVPSCSFSGHGAQRSCP